MGTFIHRKTISCYLSMKGATGKASFFSLSDWWKYSSSRQSTHPSDTWSKNSNTELFFVDIFGVHMHCFLPWLDDIRWKCRRLLSRSSSRYWGDPEKLENRHIYTKKFISNSCHHVPPRCYSQSCQASAWNCRGFPRVAPCLSPGWELSCLLAPGRRLWARDVPLLQICIFLTLFKRGGGSQTYVEFFLQIS